ncbi:MAG: glutamyl-tRNA reductase [Stellaceae bacterium]
MGAEFSPASPLLIVGVDHRSAAADLRQKFALLESDLEGALESLRSSGAGEAVLLATCDRVELALPGAAAQSAFVPLVAQRALVPESAVASALYRHEGRAALRHLFALASALDSPVIGEPHVLGQMRAAHRAAAALGLVGPVLEPAFIAAFTCARRIRRETGIAERPQSIAAAALDLARGIHGELRRLSALLIGPSDMGELLAEQFLRAGIPRLVVCGPDPLAERAAQRLNCHHAAFGALDTALAEADIVISARGTGDTVLSQTLVAAALRKRPLRPIFVIDAAHPADADPAINALDGLFLYDLADLERAAMAGRARREAAAGTAWQIVEDELRRFESESAVRRSVSAIVTLRQHFERVRQEVMNEGLDSEAATRLLVNRLLHAPSESLRALALGGDAAAGEALLRRLFRLEEEDE